MWGSDEAYGGSSRLENTAQHEQLADELCAAILAQPDRASELQSPPSPAAARGGATPSEPASLPAIAVRDTAAAATTSADADEDDEGERRRRQHVTELLQALLQQAPSSSAAGDSATRSGGKAGQPPQSAAAPAAAAPVPPIAAQSTAAAAAAAAAAASAAAPNSAGNTTAAAASLGLTLPPPAVAGSPAASAAGSAAVSPAQSLVSTPAGSATKLSIPGTAGSDATAAAAALRTGSPPPSHAAAVRRAAAAAVPSAIIQTLHSHIGRVLSHGANYKSTSPKACQKRLQEFARTGQWLGALNVGQMRMLVFVLAEILRLLGTDKHALVCQHVLLLLRTPDRPLRTAAQCLVVAYSLRTPLYLGRLVKKCLASEPPMPEYIDALANVMSDSIHVAPVFDELVEHGYNVKDARLLLILLGHLAQTEAPISALGRHDLLGLVLDYLQFHADLSSLIQGSYIIVTLMPHLCLSIHESYVERFFRVFIRLLSWPKKDIEGHDGVSLVANVKSIVQCLFLALYGLFPKATCSLAGALGTDEGRLRDQILLYLNAVQFHPHLALSDEAARDRLQSMTLSQRSLECQRYSLKELSTTQAETWIEMPDPPLSPQREKQHRDMPSAPFDAGSHLVDAAAWGVDVTSKVPEAAAGSTGPEASEVTTESSHETDTVADTEGADAQGSATNTGTSTPPKRLPSPFQPPTRRVRHVSHPGAIPNHQIASAFQPKPAPAHPSTSTSGSVTTVGQCSEEAQPLPSRSASEILRTDPKSTIDGETVSLAPGLRLEEELQQLRSDMLTLSMQLETQPVLGSPSKGSAASASSTDAHHTAQLQHQAQCLRAQVLFEQFMRVQHAERIRQLNRQIMHFQAALQVARMQSSERVAMLASPVSPPRMRRSQGRAWSPPVAESIKAEPPVAAASTGASGETAAGETASRTVSPSGGAAAAASAASAAVMAAVGSASPPGRGSPAGVEIAPRLGSPPTSSPLNSGPSSPTTRISPLVALDASTPHGEHAHLRDAIRRHEVHSPDSNEGWRQDRHEVMKTLDNMVQRLLAVSQSKERVEAKVAPLKAKATELEILFKGKDALATQLQNENAMLRKKLESHARMEQQYLELVDVLHGLEKGIPARDAVLKFAERTEHRSMQFEQVLGQVESDRQTVVAQLEEKCIELEQAKDASAEARQAVKDLEEMVATHKEALEHATTASLGHLKAVEAKYQAQKSINIALEGKIAELRLDLEAARAGVGLHQQGLAGALLDPTARPPAYLK